MNPKKAHKIFAMSVLSKSLLFALALNTANADIALTDSDFSSPMTSPIIANSTNGNVTVTTGVGTNPILNISLGPALGVGGGKTLTIHNEELFTINSTSTSAFALDLGSGNLNISGALELNFTNSRGVFLKSAQNSKFGDLKLVGTGSSLIGIMGYQTSDAGKSEFNGKVNIQMVNNGAYGIVNQSQAKVGIPLVAGYELIFNDAVKIEMNGLESVAVYAESIWDDLSNSLTHFKEGLTIESKGSGIVISPGFGSSYRPTLGEDVIIRVDKNIVINSDLNAIEVLGGQVYIDGKAEIRGNVEALKYNTSAIGGQQNALVDFNLSDQSLIVGRMDNYSVTPPPQFPPVGYPPSNVPFSGEAGIINVHFNGGSSTWDMSGTGASYINTISGNGGTLEFKSNVATGVTDTLTITDPNGASGTHKVTVANDASQATTGTETLALIYTQGGTANFVVQNQIELGGYLYEVRKASGTNNWELYSVGAKGGNSGGAITSTANAAANALNAGYLISYVDTQALLQRVGQLRENQEGIANVWVRGFAGKLDSFGGGKLSGYSMDYHAIQAGADKEFAVESGRVFLGLTAGYTRGKSDLNNWVGSSSTVKSTHLGIYGTYINESNGFYVDGLLKYVHMKHDLSVLDSIGQRVGGSGSTNGYSFSIEAGKRFEISDTAFYIEPQAQLTYNHQNSTTIRASNGLNVKLDSYDSLLGRLGVIWGYKVDDGTNKTNIYLKTSYLHEFKDQSAFALNNSWEKDNLGGHWFDVGLGVSATLNKNHNLYGDLNYSKGSRFDRKQINVGYRYEF